LASSLVSRLLMPTGGRSHASAADARTFRIVVARLVLAAIAVFAFHNASAT
jgi:hypothetical protein